MWVMLCLLGRPAVRTASASTSNNTDSHVHDCDGEQRGKQGRPDGNERDGLFESDYVFILSEPGDELDGSVARMLSFDSDGDVLVKIGGCVFAF